MKFSGVSVSAKKTGAATVPSAPAKLSLKTAVSPRDVNSVEPTDGTAASSAPTRSVVQAGVSPLTVKLADGTSVKAGASSGLSIGGSGKASLSPAEKGKAVVKEVENRLTFKDVSLGPHEGELRFRLIHFWEAWNIQTKTLIGLEMLLIDEEETVIQGFIPRGRIDVFSRHLKAGSLYRLNNFFGSRSKPNFGVAEHGVTISFSWNSVLSPLEESSVPVPEDRIRVHGYKEFDAACDLKGQLYDFLGHIKLVNGQVPTASLLLDKAEIASSRRVELHVQTHDDPVVKVSLWDNAAFEFCEKFSASQGTARVILVTTLNPKRFGVLTLSTMASSRVFLDNDVEETRVYLSWLNSNYEVANRVNAEVVTKPETATLGELFAYMKQASATVAWFECSATIDAVMHGTAWYYIGCAVCHTKATRGPTTLMCRKCGKAEIVGVAHYLTKLSVYDHDEQAVFVLLGDAGEELTGKKAGELVESYYQANEGFDADHVVPVPQSLIDTIGQTRKFVVKVSTHNLTAKTQTLTVTKVLPIEIPQPGAGLVEKADEESEDGSGDRADVSVKRGAGGIVSVGGKRPRCG